MYKQHVQPYRYESDRLPHLLEMSPYQAYVYSYPHKSAYRPLDPPVSLASTWQREALDRLFLYIHIPFCEMRCGFCNLFTTVRPDPELVEAYLTTLQRQATLVRASLPDAHFARFAIGGGTPTYLSLPQLECVLDLAEGTMGAYLQTIPTSVEVSPETATEDRLSLLRQRGIKRISIGVQSFIEAESEAVHRRQQTAQVEIALGRIRAAGFPTLNIDLMYGLPEQSVESWLASIRAALRFHPEELFLYPLYIRPVTRMGASEQAWDDLRLACYRAGRDLLFSEGYQQLSMRMFRASYAPVGDGPLYCCQQDGMVGLGCGARSYTTNLHYSSDYAVGPRHVNQILRAFVERPDSAFTTASYGFRLGEEERRRRYVLLSLLFHEGLSLPTYQQLFGSTLFDDLPELMELLSLGLATCQAERLTLTPAGIERSDTIGPWLFSTNVRQAMEAFALQ